MDAYDFCVFGRLLRQREYCPRNNETITIDATAGKTLLTYADEAFEISPFRKVQGDWMVRSL